MKRRRWLMRFLLSVLLLVAAGGLWLRQAKRQYTLNRQLIDSLKAGDTTKSLELINEGADPNTLVTALPAPALKQMLDQLLHRSSAPADGSPTAFLLACGAGWSMLEEGADNADHRENLPLITSMLAHHANLSVRTQEHQTALMGAVIQNHLQVVELLLAHGASINDWNGPIYDTPLLEAAQAGYGDMIRLLLAHGADVYRADNKGRTALHRIVMAGAEASIVRLLLVKSDSLHRDIFGRTALWYAQSMNRPDLVDLLRKGGK